MQGALVVPHQANAAETFRAAADVMIVIHMKINVFTVAVTKCNVLSLPLLYFKKIL